MIKIQAQNSFSELGKRSNNEDNYGFIEGSTFIVCDGVGGAEKGEIASEIVVSNFLNAYKSDIFTNAQSAVATAEHSLSEYIMKNPESQGMATTLAFLQVRPGGMYTAWVGDSRIYQFRNGQIIFQSRDHSWVNEALEAGILTPEEAINHPKGNVITRAIQGEYKPVQVEDKFLPNVQTDDVFLLCSDGVLEAWSDEDLSALFGQSNELADLENTLKSECAKQSRDNHTAIILKVETDLKLSNEAPLKETPLVEAIPLSSEDEVRRNTKASSNFKTILGSKKSLLMLLLSALILAFVFYKFVGGEPSEIEPTTKEQVTKDVHHKPAEKKQNEKPEKNENSNKQPSAPGVSNESKEKMGNESLDKKDS
jgi:serine/threonine protein phosphatase PrpC